MHLTQPDDLTTARQRAEDCQMRMLDAEDDNFHGSKAAVFVNALKDRIASLEADLREEQDRRQAMSNQWRTEVEALTARIEELRSDRDCEKRLRKDAEDAREAAMGRVAELQAAFRTLASAYPGAPLSRVELRTFAGMEP